MTGWIAPSDRRLRTGVVACLVLAPLCLGAAHVETTATLALVLLALAGLSRKLHRVSAGGVLPLGVATLALALLQVALTVAWWLQPGEWQLPASTWLPLSFEPVATAQAAVRGVALACGGFLAQALFAERAELRRELLGAASLAGSLVVLVGLGHAVVGWQRPWGIFGPADQAQFVSTFVNPNHLAAFLGWSGLCAMGLAITSLGGRRWWHVLSATLCGGGTVLSLSRGGIVAYAVAVLLLTAMMAMHRLRRGLVLIVAAAGTLTVAAYLAYTRIVLELWTLGGERALEKADIWQPVPIILRDFPFGIGRGALGVVYPLYAGHFRESYFFLENEWLQLLVDYGVLVGGLFIVAGLFFWIQLLRRGREEPLALVVAVGLFFLGVQNLADYSLALPAISLPAFMAWCAFLPQAHPQVVIRSSVRASLMLVATACVVVACSFVAARHDLLRETERVAGLLRARNEDGVAAGELAMKWHPADYYLPLLLAEDALKKRDPKRALPLINRSMQRAPSFSGAHILAARALLQVGARDQALLEFRLAAQYAPEQAPLIAREVWMATRSADAVVAMAGADARARHAAAQILYDNGNYAQARTLLESPAPITTASAQDLLAHLALRDSRFEAAIAHARAAQTLEPVWPGPYGLEAQALRGLTQGDAAYAALARGVENAHPHTELLRLWMVWLAEEGRLDEADKRAASLIAAAGVGADSASAYVAVGDMYDRQGKLGTALRHYVIARERSPDDAAIRLRAASVRERLGDLEGAVAELEPVATAAGGTLVRLRATLQAQRDAARLKELLGGE